MEKILERLEHIEVCADVWEQSGRTRIKAITEAVREIRKLLSTPNLESFQRAKE